jgi:myo-inositol 2-dehydrogenase/D-chiro-inositol 1-dehydrogenase
MKPTKPTSRRRFLENTALGAIGVIGASHLIKSCAPGETTSKVVEPAFLKTAVDGQPLRAGVVGCGGRGSQAAGNFLDAGPNLSIVALADVFQDRLDDLRNKLKDERNVELEDVNCFVGFDAYKRLLEVDLDYVILATPPYFRPEHFQACVEARKLWTHREHVP